MPIHDVGYRGWSGKKTSPLTRWWIIAATGVRLSFTSRWVRRLLFVAWLPVLYWGVAFFAIEQGLNTNAGLLASTDLKRVVDNDMLNEIDSELSEKASRKTLAMMLKRELPMLPKVDVLAEALESGDEDRARNTVWAWLLLTFFRYPQGLLILMLLGFVTPSLISQDVRSRAFLLYFSRPIGRLEYMFGKVMVPAIYITLVTSLPALALYLFAIMMSPESAVFWSTWDIPFRIIIATFALVIPTASLAVMLSSLTHESRFASFAWFAIWALGHGAWFAVLIAQSARMREAPFDPVVLDSNLVQTWSVLSLYNNVGAVQSWIFGFEKFTDIWPGGLALLVITAFSITMLYRRVSAPIRV